MTLQQQTTAATDLFGRCEPHAHASAASLAGAGDGHKEKGKQRALSLFEAVVTSYPPVLESLLAQLPTAALLELYHTSLHLRRFLRSYPLAWKTLSFRLPQPAVTVGSPFSVRCPTIVMLAPAGTTTSSASAAGSAVSGVPPSANSAMS